MRVHLFLVMIAILVAVAGVTVVVEDQLGADSGGTGEAQVIGDPGGAGVPTAPSVTNPVTSEPDEAPAGQVDVTGLVTSVHVEGAVLDPAEVPTPLTLVASPGFGNGAELTGVGVEGVRSTIVWDGGRPFVLAAGGALVLGTVTVDLEPDGLRAALADGEHRLRPGTYRLDAPVAIGASGVAQALDAVTFGADSVSALRTTGDTALLLDTARASHLTGRGAVRLEGELRLTEGSITRTVSSVDVPGGPFDLTLTPTADGSWTVRLTVQGQIDAG